MDFEALKNSLENKKGSKPDFPFDETTLVFKVMGKMFALVGINDDPLRVNLKCDPERAEALRAIYPSVKPGYHMNKRHWNTVVLDGTISENLILEMIDESYQLVVNALSKMDRSKLDAK